MNFKRHGNSLEVQWLGLGAFSAWGLGSDPASLKVWPKKKKKKLKDKNNVQEFFKTHS